MSHRTSAVGPRQEISFSGIRFEPRVRLRDERAERERRVEAYASQVAEQQVVKRRICFAGALCRAVRCLDFEQTFDSVGQAAKDLGLRPAGIRQAIRSGGATNGLRFEYVGEPRRLLNGRCRAVWCETTKQRFDSISDAARAHEVPISTMFDAVKTGKPTHQGRSYVYLSAPAQSRAA